MNKGLNYDQREQLKIYKDKYISIGLNTDRIDKDNCVKTIDDLYTKILKRDKVPVIILDSPYECWLAINQLEEEKGMTKKEAYRDIMGQIAIDMWYHIKEYIWTANWSHIRYEMWPEVWKEVDTELFSCVNYALTYKLNHMKQLIPYIRPYLSGHLDYSLFSFYAFCSKVLKINSHTDRFLPIWESTLNYGQIYTLDDVCLVSQKPNSIQKYTSTGLHSFEYDGGFTLYQLTGIN